MIMGESGSHFDPKMVDAFLKIDRTAIEAVQDKYRNGDNEV